MAKATVTRNDPVPERGPDLFKTVKAVNLQLTAQEAIALLVLTSRVGGAPDKTLRGEINTIKETIYRALGADPNNRRYTDRYTMRDDLITGTVEFLKGGAHV